MKTIPLLISNITVQFDCPYCGEMLSCEINDLAEPNMFADNAADSENAGEDEVICDCGHSYTITNYANMNERNIEIMNNQENVEIGDFKCDYDFEES